MILIVTLKEMKMNYSYIETAIYNGATYLRQMQIEINENLDEFITEASEIGITGMFLRDWHLLNRSSILYYELEQFLKVKDPYKMIAYILKEIHTMLIGNERLEIKARRNGKEPEVSSKNWENDI